MNRILETYSLLVIRDLVDKWQADACETDRVVVSP